MNLKPFITLILSFIICLQTNAQIKQTAAQGKLFIIGGGDRARPLMQKLIETAQINKSDYIVVLPMSSEEPDSSFYYIKMDFDSVCANPMVNFNFTPDKINNRLWLDSLALAKLIFITGGDQNRFMNAVLHTPVYDAIHTAFNNGATIAGTSAGAAVMNKYMITGNQLLGDTSYAATFDKLWNKNIEFKEGLGLVDAAIIDQHFIVRSRYNRLLSALAAHPELPCIGIDEATAIIVEGKKITVTGVSQVIEMSHPEGLKITPDGLIKFSNVCLHFYTAGDVFELK